jgi:hypothetical protein
MSTQHTGKTNVKAAYTKPSLIEYGSLAERTKIFGLPEGPTPDFIIGPIITTGSRSVTTITI